jgi:hypothetical protein
MLPTRMAVNQLMEWAHFLPPENTSSRIVVPAFRNISIDPDTFSTMPDLFSFGHIHEMEKLWGDDGFNYTQSFNMSSQDREALEPKFLDSPDLADLYCAEAEVYALYRSKLAENCNRPLRHKSVAEKYLRLIDHRQLDILWFGAQSGFRSLGQAWEHPWWTENQWARHSAKVYPYGYQSNGIFSRLKKKISKYKIQQELAAQENIWASQFQNITL